VGCEILKVLASSRSLLFEFFSNSERSCLIFCFMLVHASVFSSEAQYLNKWSRKPFCEQAEFS
jgi:hypothetical protein